MLYDSDGRLLHVNDQGIYTDEQCKTAFISYMNKRADEFGMSGTYYASPSGLTQSSYATPQDQLKLGVVVTAYQKALEIWSAPEQDFAIRGNHARTIHETGLVGGMTTLLSGTATFLGGKGGSLIYSDYHKAYIILVGIGGHAAVLSLMALGEDVYKNRINPAIIELCQMVVESLNGQTPIEGENLQALVAANGGYAACIVPTAPGGYVNTVSPATLLTQEQSVSNAATVTRYPASTSKTMTMICALDYASNIEDSITVKTSDIDSGSGSTFYDGDRLKLIDALKIMMMESSNTLANAIARTIGARILAYNS